MKNILLVALIAFSFIGCKKDGAVSLKGSWTIDNVVSKSYLDNTLNDTETEPGNGAKIDFKDGGQYVATKPGEPDETGTYSIEGSKLTLDGGVFDIQNLTNSKVTLFYSDDIGSGFKVEIFINLKK